MIRVRRISDKKKGTALNFADIFASFYYLTKGNERANSICPYGSKLSRSTIVNLITNTNLLVERQRLRLIKVRHNITRNISQHDSFSSRYYRATYARHVNDGDTTAEQIYCKFLK